MCWPLNVMPTKCRTDHLSCRPIIILTKCPIHHESPNIFTKSQFTKSHADKTSRWQNLYPTQNWSKCRVDKMSFDEMSSPRFEVSAMINIPDSSDISTETKCHKTFYSRNLRLLVIIWSVWPWQAFTTKFLVKGWSLPKSGAPVRCLARVGSGLAHKH
jgi:hypothetical protein